MILSAWCILTHFLLTQSDPTGTITIPVPAQEGVTWISRDHIASKWWGQDGNSGGLGSTALTYSAVLPTYLIPCPPRKVFNWLQGTDCMGSFTFSNLVSLLSAHGWGRGMGRNREEPWRADCIPADLKLVLAQLVSAGPLCQGQIRLRRKCHKRKDWPTRLFPNI